MSVLPSIDAILGGAGLVPGRIVELCGDPGTGKTALTIKAISKLVVDDPEAEVIIFDNNGFFPVQRLYSFLQHCPNMNEDLSLKALERVHICHAIFVTEFVDTVESTIADFNPKIKLVVVDNISNYFRSYFSSELHEKVTAIKYVGMLLRRLARTHNVPILLNNHMTTAYREKDRPDSGLKFVPYLGDTWTFMVDQRVELRYWHGEAGRRRGEITKSVYSIDPKFMQPFGYTIKEEDVVDLGFL